MTFCNMLSTLLRRHCDLLLGDVHTVDEALSPFAVCCLLCCGCTVNFYSVLLTLLRMYCELCHQ